MAGTDTAKELLQPFLRSIRVPNSSDKVFKDECVFSFDSPESDTGLYVCMNSFLGLGRDHVERYVVQTGNRVFLHLVKIKNLIPEDKTELEPEKKITRLAIGIEGGFQAEGTPKYEIQEKYSIAIFPGPTVIELPHPDLPLQVESSIQGILSAHSASYLEAIQAMESTWDGEARKISIYAENLKQLDNGIKVPPSGWQCAHCDKNDNLWLNLTDGAVLCGRKFFDGTGGNNHAVEHYQSTGYPLAVKLGTIAGDGKADVYSYAEDDMVEDPHLKKHLAHFGINMEGMQKTDKSMAELEIDLNQRVGEWATIQESGASLLPLFGPGYTGLANLGNSCYLNSVVQVIFTVPKFQERFYEQAERVFQSAGLQAWQDFNVQMAKLGVGIMSGRYSKPPPGEMEMDEGTSTETQQQPQQSIKPAMFKALIGKGHPEFSTKRQQDAVDFLLHLINMTERHVRNHPASTQSPAESFRFQVEDRLQCLISGQVRYSYRWEYYLPVPVPLETATNLDQVRAYEERKKAAEASGQHIKPEDVVRPKVSLQSCLEALVRPEEVHDFYSSAIGAKTTVFKSIRLSSFPEFLWIQLRKFTFAEDWTPRKLDVAVEMPCNLDLAWMKSSGPQSGEVLMKDEPSGGTSAAASQPPLDMEIVGSLSEMGFPVEACKRAAYQTRGQGLEAATQWVMEHIDDPDFLEPFQMPGAGPQSGAAFQPNEEGVAMLEAMGFTRAQCIKALQNTDNNVERAADWIFSHPDEINSVEADAPLAAANPSPAAAPEASSDTRDQNQSSAYELTAFVSHMGTSANVGHYVCHIKKDDRWVIFNDEKVALSQIPPMELGYLYLYRRVNPPSSSTSATSSSQ